jgi:hypothetical protein
MRITFGLALIAWGLITLFVLPDAVPQKFINYVILGMYVIAIFWWCYHTHTWWTAYWTAACAITLVVTFGDLTVR